MKSIDVPMENRENFPPYRRVTVKEISYSIGHQIAKGHFGTLYEATDTWNNPLAVKVYNRESDEKIVDNEIKQLKKFASPYTVNLYEAFSHEGFHFLIMERFGVAISRVKTKDFDTKVKIFTECARSLLQVLHTIHQRGYMHGDINPQNVLIEIKNNQISGVKLCDFSFCRKVDSAEKTFMGVANWLLPPELAHDGIERLSGAADVYHAALVLHSLLRDEKLDYTEKEILENKPQIDAFNSESHLIRALAPALEINTQKRVSALELWKNLIGAAN